MKILSRNLNVGSNVLEAVPTKEHVELMINKLEEKNLSNGDYNMLETGVLIGLFIEKGVFFSKTVFYYYSNFNMYKVELIENTELIVTDDYVWGKLMNASSTEFAVTMSKCKYLQKIENYLMV